MSGTTMQRHTESVTHRVGDVFQINEREGRAGWIGAFVLATDIYLWGIQGFVVCIKTHDVQEHAYIRLEWKCVDYIGHAALLPKRDDE